MRDHGRRGIGDELEPALDRGRHGALRGDVVDDRITHVVLGVVDDLVERPEAHAVVVEVARAGRQVVDRGHEVGRGRVGEVDRLAVDLEGHHVLLGRVVRLGVAVVVGDLADRVGVDHAGRVVRVPAVAGHVLVVVVVAVGALQDGLELRAVHSHGDERVLVRHEGEHVGHLEGDRVRPAGGDCPVRHRAGQVDVREDAVLVELEDRRRRPAGWRRWSPA